MDIPFGPPPEEYSYRCSQCHHEKKNVLIVASFIDSIVNDKSTYWSVDTGDGAVAGIVSSVEAKAGYISSFSGSHGDRHDGIVYSDRPPALLYEIPVG